MRPFYKTYTGKTSIPEPINFAGTITSKGITVFRSAGIEEVKVGDFIYNQTPNEIRKITKVFNKNTLEIESAFTSDIIAAISLKIADRIKYKRLSVYNIGAVDGSLMNSAFKAGLVVEYEDLAGGLDPITINGTGTTIAVSTQQ